MAFKPYGPVKIQAKGYDVDIVDTNGESLISRLVDEGLGVTAIQVENTGDNTQKITLECFAVGAILDIDDEYKSIPEKYQKLTVKE